MLLLLTQICASPEAGDGKCIHSVQEVASDSPLKFQADVISSLVIDVALEPDTTKSEELKDIFCLTHQKLPNVQERFS